LAKLHVGARAPDSHQKVYRNKREVACERQKTTRKGGHLEKEREKLKEKKKFSCQCNIKFGKISQKKKKKKIWKDKGTGWFVHGEEESRKRGVSAPLQWDYNRVPKLKKSS